VRRCRRNGSPAHRSYLRPPPSTELNKSTECRGRKSIVEREGEVEMFSFYVFLTFYTLQRNRTGPHINRTRPRSVLRSRPNSLLLLLSVLLCLLKKLPFSHCTPLFIVIIFLAVFLFIYASYFHSYYIFLSKHIYLSATFLGSLFIFSLPYCILGFLFILVILFYPEVVFIAFYYFYY